MDAKIRAIAEQCSRLNTGIPESALFQLRPYIEDFLDANWLEDKLGEYENWASKNSDPVLIRSYLHRPFGFNMLVASIWAARDWERIRKEDPSFSLPSGAKRLVNVACSLAVLELHADQLLDSEAREHLRQRLQAVNEVWGVIHELQTFAYFIRRGAKVEPHFLKKANPKELIVHWHGVHIPVQCKCKPSGSGRIIRQDIFTDLACRISRDTKASGKRLLVRIGSTGKIQHEHVEFLRNKVSAGVGAGIGPALVTYEDRTFTISSQPLSGQFTTDTIQDYLSSFNFHVGMVIGEPTPNRNAYNTVAVVGIDASIKEKTWRSLRDSIKKGAIQLQNGPPGIIAIYYTDPVGDFETLCPDPGHMIIFVGRILDRFPQVGAVIMASEPDPQLPQTNVSGHIKIYHRKPWPFPNDFLSDESF
jgi:hypothetical protein